MRLLKWTLFLTLAAGLLLGLAVIFRVALANWLLQRAAAIQEIPLMAELTALEPDRIVFRNLRFAEPGQAQVSAAEIELRFTPSALQDGWVDSIVLRSPVIELPAAEENGGAGQQASPTAPPTPASEPAAWPPALLIRQLSIEDGRLIVHHEGQRFESGFTGEARLTGDGPWSAALDAKANGDLGVLNASLSAEIDGETIRSVAIAVEGRLAPPANALLPPHVRLGEDGNVSGTLKVTSPNELPLRTALEPESLRAQLAAMPFAGTLDLAFRDLFAPGWAEAAEGDALLSLDRQGQSLVVDGASRLRVSAQPSADLPAQAREALALLDLPDERLALSLTPRVADKPLATVSFDDSAARLALSAAAELSSGETEALALSTESLLQLDLEAGRLHDFQSEAIEVRCRCRAPDTQEVLSLSAASGLRYADGELVLPGTLTASLQGGEGDDLAVLLGQPDLAGLLGPRVAFRLRPRRQDAPLVAMTKGADKKTALSWQVDARLWSGGALSGLLMSAGGSASLPADASPPRLARGDLALATSPIVWGGQQIEALRLSGVMEGTPDDMAARLRLAFAAPRLQQDDIAVSDVAVQSEIAARLTGNDLSLRLTAPTEIRLATIEGLPAQTSDPLDLSLSQGTASISLTQERRWNASAAGTLAPLRISAEGRRVGLGETAFSFTLQESAGDLPSGEGRIAVGALSLDEPAVNAGRSRLDLESDGESLRLALAPTRIRQSVAPEAPASVTLSGNARLVGQRLAGRARAVLTQGAEARIDFSHDLASQRGRAAIAVPEIAFLPGGLQPSALSPLLAEIEEVSGGLAGEAQLAWQKGALSGSAQAEARQLSFKRGELFVEGLDSSLSLDSLFPLASEGMQSFTATRLGSGALALEEIAGRFEVTSAGPEAVPTLRLEDAGGHFADGQLRLAGQVLQAGALLDAGRVEAENIDLALLLSRLQVEGLSGRGRLSGQLPLRLEGDTVIVEGGELSANAPGRIAYNSPTARQALATAGDHMQLTLDALEDFYFTDLALRLDKPATGDSELAITLQGSNPKVLDNYPFRFNIRLIGDPAPFISAIKEGTRLSDEILRRAWRLSQ